MGSSRKVDGEHVNGWSETTAQSHRASYDSFLGVLTMDVARSSRGEKEVAWLTRPVPRDLNLSRLRRGLFDLSA